MQEAEQALIHEGYDKASDRTVILAGFSYLARAINGNHNSKKSRRAIAINLGLPIVGGGAALAWFMDIAKSLASR